MWAFWGLTSADLREKNTKFENFRKRESNVILMGQFVANENVDHYCQEPTCNYM
jgi:hypothetical protein